MESYTSVIATLMVRDKSPYVLEEGEDPSEDELEDEVDDPLDLPDRLDTGMDVESFTLPELNRLIHEVKIDLNPPYQRGLHLCV